MYDQLMQNHDVLLNAVEIVLSWDLSDDGFADVVGAQADLMAGRYYD